MAVIEEDAQSSIVQATIISIGDTMQVTPKFAKFMFEYQVAGLPYVMSGESPSWHRGKIEVGSSYELVLKANPNPSGGFYTPSVEKIDAIGTVAQTQNGQTPEPAIILTPNPAPVPEEKPEPVTQPKPVPVAKRQPDLNGRWREYSTHSRTAQMQATERVGQYIQLILAGKLVTDGNEPIKSIRKATIDEWVSTEINKYWREIEVRKPEDAFDDFGFGE